MKKLLIIFMCAFTFGFAQYTIEWSSGSGSINNGYANIDVDNDGLNELAIITSDGIAFYDGNYTACWTIPIITGFTNMGYAIPRDINGDGLIVPINSDNDPSGELITYSYSMTPYTFQIRIYDVTTRNLEWESPLLQGICGGVQVEDLDGDGKAEIIVRRSVNANNYYVDIYAYNGSGVEENIYTEKFSSQIFQNPMPRTSLPKGSFELYDLLGRIQNGQNIKPGVYFLNHNDKRIKIIVE